MDPSILFLGQTRFGVSSMLDEIGDLSHAPLWSIDKLGDVLNHPLVPGVIRQCGYLYIRTSILVLLGTSPMYSEGISASCSRA
jgi:hypothetical protein